MNGFGAGCGWAKSSTSARLRAARSRLVSGLKPNRHSTIFMIDVWSYTLWPTKPGRENEENMIVGTRKPAWPRSLGPPGAPLWSSGSRGGRTWSKNPPHSS